MLKAFPLHYGNRMTIWQQSARPDSSHRWTRRQSWSRRQTPYDSCSTVERTVSRWTASRTTILPTVQ